MQATEEKEYVFVSAVSPTGAKLRESLTASAVFLESSPTSSSSTERSSPRGLVESDNDDDDVDDEALAVAVGVLALDEADDVVDAPCAANAECDTGSSTGVTAGDESDDSVELEDMPMVLPFLPALDASTQITKFEGFSEAISDAQQLLDSRLLAYSQYQQMARPEQALLTPRMARSDRFVLTDRQVVLDRPVTVCMGWQRVSGVDASSRELLRVLEEDGVSYEPHDLAYSVKYLAPVAPFGDCLFLSIEQLLLYTDECEPLAPTAIRAVATDFFLQHYTASSAAEQKKIDSAIQNLYFPSLAGGWGVSPVQTRRFVARRSDKDALYARCVALHDRGYSWLQAAEAVYSQFATPVVDAHAYCDYMRVGSGGARSNDHFLIGLHYSRSGLVSVDSDTDDSRVAWGDDLVLEALATAYQRDIFVVLVGCGKMFFLPHRPRSAGSGKSHHPKGHAPWFLLMRLTGSDRGGDHYEPMLCERLRGDGSSEFGCIGD